MADLTGAIWRKSTRSNNGGNCVEVATNLTTANVVPMRDSKDPTGPALIFTTNQWADFIAQVKDGRFDL